MNKTTKKTKVKKHKITTADRTRIKKLLTSKKLSQAGIAKKCGVSESSVSRIKVATTTTTTN